MTIGIPTLPPTPQAPRPRSRRGITALALVVLVATGAAVAWWQTRANDSEADDSAGATVVAVTDPDARPPEGTRIRLRVLNTSGVSGLARRATTHLREFGFDVVDFGSGTTDKSADTRIMVHTGHPDWAARVQKALGVGTLGTDSDSSHYVDLTVFVGRDWRPSTQPLRP